MVWILREIPPVRDVERLVNRLGISILVLEDSQETGAQMCHPASEPGIRDVGYLKRRCGRTLAEQMEGLQRSSFLGKGIFIDKDG